MTDQIDPRRFNERFERVERMLGGSARPRTAVLKAILELSKQTDTEEELQRVEALAGRAREKYEPWWSGKVVELARGESVNRKRRAR